MPFSTSGASLFKSMLRSRGRRSFLLGGTNYTWHVYAFGQRRAIQTTLLRQRGFVLGPEGQTRGPSPVYLCYLCEHFGS